MTPPIFEIADDDGFLALVDPDAYESFVAKQWTLDQLVQHFRRQMRERRLLLWGTGREETWRVALWLEAAAAAGFREVTGPITTTRGRLFLGSYASLTMAATYDDVTLPEPHETPNVLRVPAGDYRCRIVQMRDPEADVDDDWILRGVHFVIELTPDAAGPASWAAVPWADL
jgi:hypothetical protein